MAACVVCAVTMTVNERSVNKAGTAMALHVDCAHREEMQRLAIAGNWPKSDQNNIANEIARLALKRAGSPAQWP